jgi:hypothetical protein
VECPRAMDVRILGNSAHKPPSVCP